MGVERTLVTIRGLQEGNIRITECVFLTDSQITLDWIKAPPGKNDSGPFVVNRITAIRSAAAELEERQVPTKFGHVRSEENPADIGTRGADKGSIDQSDWFGGTAIYA
ncbi:hypothetical protein B9Z55_007091 [Caenorhabditis nigoni]|uniref:RNase H type-1 domain-containing protein n=1 Tax=Caenorhabditis nigoni TaxID=1611254 RepID=A0A2G5V810_9PELO|nr:hypothetical protein B9Z55_007091 [Caenorhabditis nigoni]